MAKQAKRAARPPKLNPKRNIVPDQLDLRDRPYLPTLLAPPAVEMAPVLKLPVLHQERTSACTGFALASVVNFLLRRHRGSARARDVALHALFDGAPLRRVPGSPQGARRAQDAARERQGRHRIEPAGGHERLVQAWRLPAGPVARSRDAAARRDAGNRLVVGRGAAPARRLLPRRHALGHGHARGPPRRRHSLRERALSLGLAQGRPSGRRQDDLDDPARRDPGG